MTLKVGDRIRRNGSNVASWAPFGYETVVTKGLTYTDVDGYEGVSINSADWDLIAEWTEGPVRTVTRTVTETTITPGTYARITVNDEGKAGMVGLWLNSGHYFSPSDLRAAAAVLLELAGALDA